MNKALDDSGCSFQATIMVQMSGLNFPDGCNSWLWTISSQWTDPLHRTVNTQVLWYFCFIVCISEKLKKIPCICAEGCTSYCVNCVTSGYQTGDFERVLGTFSGILAAFKGIIGTSGWICVSSGRENDSAQPVCFSKGRKKWEALQCLKAECFASPLWCPN